MMDSTLYIASFNAERFWRSTTIAQLPSFKDSQADHIVEVMDEMQFLFARNSGDVVCTRYPMNSVHKDYLGELGFEFKSNDFPLNFAVDTLPDLGINISTLILQQSDGHYFERLFKIANKYSPYAILPADHELFIKYQFVNTLPDLKVVKKVNSKIFSTELALNIGIAEGGKIANTADELKQIGTELLKTTPCLIKDAFGVSGKGNILVEHGHTLNHIYKYLLKQEDEGKIVKFIMEPLLKRKVDFSCQFFIHPDGSYQVIALQEMLNNKFSFSGIRKLSSSFYPLLDKAKYFDHVTLVAKSLHLEGYHGPVCLDSMILENDQIVPVIEINARKSMGFLNQELYKFLAPYEANCDLITYAFGSYDPISFEDLYVALKQNKLLFNQNAGNGLLPITANTVDINSRFFKNGNLQGLIKGRWYAGLVYKNETDRNELDYKVRCVLNNLNLKILN